MQKRLFVFILCLAGASTAWAGTLVPSTSKPTYAIGESITFIATNIGPWPVTFSNSSEFETIFWAYDDQNNLVYEPPQIIITVWNPVYIFPGASRSWTWDVHSQPLMSGDYYLCLYNAPPVSWFHVVPEPSAVLTSLCGIGGLRVFMRRRRTNAHNCGAREQF